jgi:hypothetical protein
LYEQPSPNDFHLSSIRYRRPVSAQKNPPPDLSVEGFEILAGQFSSALSQYPQR